MTVNATAQETVQSTKIKLFLPELIVGIGIELIGFKKMVKVHKPLHFTGNISLG